MSDVKIMSASEHKAYQDKVKPFQTAIDLVTLAQQCVSFGWSVPHGRDGNHMHAHIKKGHKQEIQEILARHGIPAQWNTDENLGTDVFVLPTDAAEKHPMLKSLRAVKDGSGRTSSTNLVLQLSALMPNQK